MRHFWFKNSSFRLKCSFIIWWVALDRRLILWIVFLLYLILWCLNLVFNFRLTFILLMTGLGLTLFENHRCCVILRISVVKVGNVLIISHWLLSLWSLGNLRLLNGGCWWIKWFQIMAWLWYLTSSLILDLKRTSQICECTWLIKL